MTTMNNEDPADTSVHVPRVLDAADDPLPQPRVPNHVLECMIASIDPRRLRCTRPWGRAPTLIARRGRIKYALCASGLMWQYA